jgi:hypothetical protein
MARVEPPQQPPRSRTGFGDGAISPVVRSEDKIKKRLTDPKLQLRIEYMFDIGGGSGGRTPDGLCGRTPTSA